MRQKLIRRTIAELSTISVLTALVLVLLPGRPPWVNMALALVGMTLILLNRRYTKDELWAQFPIIGDRYSRLKDCTASVGLFTLVGLLLFVIITCQLGVTDRLLNPRTLVALPLYVAWALLQQYLFQFFLLGRLLVLMPATLAISCTGLVFALSHYPHPLTMAVTGGAGAFWSLHYYRYRLLWPLAASHAVLGAALFYWVYGQDLLTHWKPL